jgi:hypothetical protein
LDLTTPHPDRLFVPGTVLTIPVRMCVIAGIPSSAPEVLAAKPAHPRTGGSSLSQERGEPAPRPQGPLEGLTVRSCSNDCGTPLSHGGSRQAAPPPPIGPFAQPARGCVFGGRKRSQIHLYLDTSSAPLSACPCPGRQAPGRVSVIALPMDRGSSFAQARKRSYSSWRLRPKLPAERGTNTTRRPGGDRAASARKSAIGRPVRRAAAKACRSTCGLTPAPPPRL